MDKRNIKLHNLKVLHDEVLSFVKLNKEYYVVSLVRDLLTV